MKKYFGLILVLVIGLMVVGCGKQDLSKYVGTYVEEYEKYVGDTDENKKATGWTLELKEDGTGTSTRDGSTYNMTWEVDGEKFKMTETFIGKLEYNGTIKDGVIDIFNGEKTNDFTLEAVFKKN